MIPEDATDSVSRESWARVPSTATAAGLAFYRQHVADLRLAASESSLVDELERLATTVARAIFKEREPRETLPSVFDDVDRARATKDANLGPLREVLVARYIDNFLAYVAELMGLLFRHQPAALSSREQVSLEDVLRHGSIDEFVTWAADERINRLSYKGLGEIADYFGTRFGLELVDDLAIRRDLLRGVAVRNLLVHRRGVVDRRFIATLSAEGFDVDRYALGERIPTVNNFETLPAVALSVRSLEARVVAKFGVPVHEVDAHQWWVAR